MLGMGKDSQVGVGKCAAELWSGSFTLPGEDGKGALPGVQSHPRQLSCALPGEEGDVQWARHAIGAGQTGAGQLLREGPRDVRRDLDGWLAACLCQNGGAEWESAAVATPDYRHAIR